MKINDILESNAYRPLSTIAQDIRKDWKNISPYAKPYLDAMADLNKITDNYHADTGYSVVMYFLSNAAAWKGEAAKKIKAELKSIAAGKPVPDFAKIEQHLKHSYPGRWNESVEHEKLELNKYYVISDDGKEVFDGPFNSRSQANRNCKMHSENLGVNCEVMTGAEVQEVLGECVIVLEGSYEISDIAIGGTVIYQEDSRVRVGSRRYKMSKADSINGMKIKLANGKEISIGDVVSTDRSDAKRFKIAESIITEGINFAVMQQKIYDFVLKKLKEKNSGMHASYAAELARTTDQFFTTAFDDAHNAFNKAEDKSEVEDNLRTTIQEVSKVIVDFFGDEMNHPTGYAARTLIGVEYDDPTDEEVEALIKKIDPQLDKELADRS